MKSALCIEFTAKMKSIPRDTLQCIFGFCDRYKLLASKSVCKTWFHTINHPSFSKKWAEIAHEFVNIYRPEHFSRASAPYYTFVHVPLRMHDSQNLILSHKNKLCAWIPADPTVHEGALLTCTPSMNEGNQYDIDIRTKSFGNVTKNYKLKLKLMVTNALACGNQHLFYAQREHDRDEIYAVHLNGLWPQSPSKNSLTTRKMTRMEENERITSIGVNSNETVFAYISQAEKGTFLEVCPLVRRDATVSLFYSTASGFYTLEKEPYIQIYGEVNSLNYPSTTTSFHVSVNEHFVFVIAQDQKDLKRAQFTQFPLYTKETVRHCWDLSDERLDSIRIRSTVAQCDRILLFAENGKILVVNLL